MHSNDLQHLYLGDILVYVPNLKNDIIKEYHIKSITPELYSCDIVLNENYSNWTVINRDDLQNYMLLKDAKLKYPQYFI